MTAAASPRSISGWARLAGILLVFDGIAALLVGLVSLALFRPVAAIEGQPSPDQTLYILLVPAILFALACFWAGQRAIRGIRAGRMVGVLLAGAMGLLFAYLPFTDSMSVSELAVTAALLVPQILIIVGLLRWAEASGV